VASSAVTNIEAWGYLAEKLRQQAREPNVLAYKPHPKQETFHRSTSKTRLYIGGNRSGKTVGGVVEAIWYLTGTHPYKSTPVAPVRGRAVCVDYNKGIKQILIPQFKQWVPPSELKGGSWERAYHSDDKVLTFKNGSTLEFMSYEQRLDAFAGTSRHFVMFDEEPPKTIYDECMARLIDTNGDAWLTLTPIHGMSWIHDAIYKPGEGTDAVTQVDIHENPYLNPEAVARYLDSLDPDERKARECGAFIEMGGLVYKNWKRDTHTIPFTKEVLEEALKGTIYTSMDHGYNAMTSWLWHSVMADGTIITFYEHSKAEMTVAEHCKEVKRVEKELKIPKPLIRIADPATAQRQGVTGTSIQTEYAINGIGLSSGNNDVMTGVLKVQQYLGINPNTNKPYWIIADNCTNLIWEIPRLRWKTAATKAAQLDRNPQEQIHKKDDHACDSARYFFSFMPSLQGPEVEPPVAEIDTSGKRYDTNLARTSWAFTEGVDTLCSLEWE